MAAPPHRKRVRRFDVAGHLHELTFSCYRRKPLLTIDDWRRVLAENLQSACESEGFGLLAFVFMPEHVHLLVEPVGDNAKVSRLLARVKQPTSKAIRQRLMAHGAPLLAELTVQERPGKKCFRFWQAGGGYDRNLFTAKAIEASLNYIHANPVRRGLVRQAADWKWSSARFCCLGELDPDLPAMSRLDSRWLEKAGAQTEPG